MVVDNEDISHISLFNFLLLKAVIKAQVKSIQKSIFYFIVADMFLFTAFFFRLPYGDDIFFLTDPLKSSTQLS
ncbi:hypothetical protein UO85_10400 [Enterobacter kobei]|nr:hypothetical protein UO85_10400 [Enterobacter kobei]